MKRAWLVTALLLMGSAASAAPDNRPVVGPESRPAAAPPPDSADVNARPALADDRRIVGILEVRVDGIPEEVRETFQRGLKDKLDSKRYYLIDRAGVRQNMMRSTKWTEGCVVGQCLAEVHKHTGADFVLLAALTGSGTSFGYVVTLVRTDNGDVLRQDSDRCDVCTVNEAMGKAMQATVDLLDRVPDKLPDEAAEQGATIDLAVSRVEKQLEARQRRTTRIGIALALTGLAAAIAGGVLLASDEDDAGMLTMAAGGALAAGGVVVLTF